MYTAIDSTGYFVDVTVSSYKNGVVSGTFEGKIGHVVSINPTVVEDAVITGGEIDNCRITYGF